MNKVFKREIVEKGVTLFGTPEKFYTWMNTFIPALNCKPITLWDSDRLQELYDELGRIEHGIIS